MDCFVARAPLRKRFAFFAGNDVERAVLRPSALQISNSRYTSAFSRREAPEVCVSLSLERGSRECRMRAAPAVSCANWIKENAHEHTGSAEALRHSLRNGFTAYAVISPATNSFCHRRCRLDG